MKPHGKSKKDANSKPTQQEAYKLKQFLAGNEPNSQRARNNLTKLCQTYPNLSYELEIIDVLKDFKPALEYNVLLTPALLVFSSEQPLTIYGDLSDTQKLLNALRLTEGSDE